jgi:hypothetical protein
MTDETTRVTPEQAIRHSQYCVEHKRPVGWLMVRELLRALGVLQAQLAESQGEVAALNRERAHKRSRGTAGEPRL